MTTLSTEAVETIFRSCLADDDDPSEGTLTDVIDGIVFQVRFVRKRIEEHAAEIGALLLELPDTFRRSGGGGMSFLNACDDRHGVQWASFHQTMSQLFCLGQACGYVKYLLPREMWSALPGGMPYIVIDDDQIATLA